MVFLKYLFYFLAGFLFLQLLYPFLTVLLARLFGREKRLATAPATSRAFDFACVITAYKNAAIAGPLVRSLLRQTYPNLMVYLVADECPPVDLGIADPRFVYLTPDPPLRLKVKSIRYAVDRFQREHDFIAVFDADNLAHPGFFEEINRYANAGFRCIQGQRTAKNLDTVYAALDSLGEHYKNYLERRVPYLLGGSAVISGSGMATEAGLYRAYLESPEISQGQHQGKKMLQEDKILQNFLLRRDERIAYAHRAVVYDEKVTTGDAVATQRSRWLFSYFQNLPNSTGLLWRGLTRPSWNQLYFGFVTLVLPMFIQLALAGLLALLALWVAPAIALALTAAVAVFGLTILWTLRLDEAPAPVWKAVWQAPRFVARQVAGLLRIGDPHKNFKPTEHSKYVSVDDLLEK
jgi:cellulose synthase/poly-beta-1,6-N-acetylglucosamine synthase-like glycosyltransferase